MKNTLLKTAIAAALVASAPATNAAVSTFNWTGVFTMLDGAGGAVANSSTLRGQKSQTAVTGTMAFDTTTGAGTATLVPFDFFAGTEPAAAVGINMQAIGDGAGGAGSLVLGNMLFNWDGKNGIPVSIVLDAAGFFASQDPTAIGAFGDPWADGTLDQSDNLIVNTGATPASDGTFVGSDVAGGYLNLGPAPIATTYFNTTNDAACVFGVDLDYGSNVGGGCMGISPSGVLPLIVDTATNNSDFDLNGTPTAGGYLPLANEGIGGSPMQDGPFQNFSANFEILGLTATGSDPNATIAPFCEFDPSGNLCAPPQIPVPAAVWLFGSGLLGLVGVARRKKSKV